MRYQIESKHYDYYVGCYKRGLGKLPHIHTHLEMVYLVKGKAICVANGNQYELNPGDLFVAFPNQIHFYLNVEYPIEHYLIIFSSEIDSSLKKSIINKVPYDPIIKAKELFNDLESELNFITNNRHGNEYDRLRAKGKFLNFLGTVLPRFEYVPSKDVATQDSVQDALAYCVEHYTEPLSLESVAKELHLNKYYVSHIFKERANMNFTQFVNSLRVDRAKELLVKKDMNITEAAYSAGFSSIRTFNRVFMQQVGVTPRDYVKMYQYIELKK